MDTAFEGEIIRQCAPTLAGIKTANLFMYTFSSYGECLTSVHNVQSLLRNKDIYLEVLRFNIVKHSALLFVYREKGLETILAQKASQDFLLERGFTAPFSTLAIIDELTRRLNSGGEFPHEIGLLLGYPLDDVKSYIEAPHAPGLCAGCWKAYSNPQQAQSYFAQCRCCIDAYVESYLRGMPLERLALAV